MANRSENSSNFVVRVGALTMMVILTASCGSNPPATAEPDPTYPNISYASAPRFICIGDKNPIQFSINIEVPEVLLSAHTAWYKLFDVSGGIAEQIGCDWTEFDTSGVVSFDGITLNAGSYRFAAGLSASIGCDIYSYAYLPYDLFVDVDSLSCMYRELAFDVYRQAFYDPMPLGLAAVQNTYVPVAISLVPIYASDVLAVDTLWFFDQDLIDYMFQNYDSWLGLTDHLFGIRGFKRPLQPFLSDTYGYALDASSVSHRAVFTCAGAIALNFPSAVYHEAVSSTTAHEFAHLIAGLSDACVRPDSHVVGTCIMSDLTFVAPDTLVLLCDYQSPPQTWPYSDQFCDSCFAILRYMSW